jgi:hypothetical protein
MTKNRAAKLTARTIAADQDVRRPKAAYLDDRRKLRLPDGTVHNFAYGALHPRTRNEETQRLWVAHVMREAASKGWRLIQHGGHTADEAAVAIDALRAAGPALILIHLTHWVELERDAFYAMSTAHETLNILISWLPRGCTVDPAPWESMRPTVDSPRSTALPSTSTVELLKARIAFARRYADMNEMGAHPAEALEALAADMQGFGTESAAAIAVACKDSAEGVRKGVGGEDLWGPQRSLLGAHMVRMLILGADSGDLGRGLRRAAETLEADLRIGVAA